VVRLLHLLILSAYISTYLLASMSSNWKIEMQKISSLKWLGWVGAGRCLKDFCQHLSKQSDGQPLPCQLYPRPVKCKSTHIRFPFARNLTFSFGPPHFLSNLALRAPAFRQSDTWIWKGHIREIFVDSGSHIHLINGAIISIFRPRTNLAVILIWLFHYCLIALASIFPHWLSL